MSLLVLPLLTVRVYSPLARVESRTRKVPSGMSRSLLETSSLVGGRRERRREGRREGRRERRREGGGGGEGREGSERGRWGGRRGKEEGGEEGGKMGSNH